MLHVLLHGQNYVGSGVGELPDCILDAEMERDRLEANRPAIEDRYGALEIALRVERTRDELEADVIDLRRAVQIGDHWRWFYSGHGSNRWRPSAHDGLKDEALVGFDGLLLLDDRVAAILSGMKGTGALIFDSCYGGGMLDTDLLRRSNLIPRFWQSPESVPQELYESASTVGRMENSSVLLHAGGREGQLTYSTGVGGAFSLARHACWAPGMTWRQLQKAIVPAHLPSDENPQHPKLVGGLGVGGMRDDLELV